MNVVIAEVEELVQKELESANQKFPMFRSDHEGAAVIFEEIEETESEIEGARTFSTTYQPVIADILDNYGLTGGFDNYGGIETLQIIDIPESNRANERVIFRLLTPGGTGYYDLDHTNFGSTEFAPFEDLRQSLNLD